MHKLLATAGRFNFGLMEINTTLREGSYFTGNDFEIFDRTE